MYCNYGVGSEYYRREKYLVTEDFSDMERRLVVE